MFTDAFIKLDPQKSQKMTELINPFLDVRFDPQSATVMVHQLSFYEGYFLTELCAHDKNPPLIRYAICNDRGEVHVLNWMNETIFKLNKIVPIQLNDDTVMDYIRFFFDHVRGPHGRFLIIDTVDDIDWREEPAPAGRKALGKLIEPMHLLKKEKEGGWVFKTTIVFKDSLFVAEAHVKPDGHISMNNEELLVEDIPVADDLLGQ